MEKSKVFMIMPFDDEFFETYELLKQQFQDEFEFSHASEEDNQQNILADIIQPISQADIVIADLTGLSPNVMYELGIAHGLNRNTIVITKDDLSTLPFDLNNYRARKYNNSYKSFNDLIEYLRKNMRGAIDGSVMYSNPVKDFLDKNRMTLQDYFHCTKKEDIQKEISESGFLDFVAEIEEGMVAMLQNTQELSANMDTMTKGVNHCTDEITKGKQVSGQGVSSLIRTQARKAAGYIETFSGQLKTHNSINTALWTKIEKNTLGLLENKFSSQECNREKMLEFLLAMKTLKPTLSSAKTGMLKMKEAGQNLIGIEKSLTQSIRFLDEDLTNYIDFTDQMCCGIDRILDKSKFVVGQI